MKRRALKHDPLLCHVEQCRDCDDKLTGTGVAPVDPVAELAAASRAVVEAWDFDEVGQVDGEHVERLRKALREVAP